eukprot:gene36999-41888_t
MSNKAGSRNQHPGRSAVDESDLSPKPLSATLLQEFQNLKDKFKNEDGEEIKGESFSSAEVTEVFFGVTKLFQSKDVNLRRMMYLFIKEV